MGRIRRTLAAQQDYLEIWYYIAADNKEAANRVVRAFDAALNMLATHPQAGQRRPRLFPGLRSFSVGRYLLFYRVMPDGIELLRVIHGARKFQRKMFDE